MKKVYQLAVVAAIVFLLTGVAFAGNRVIVTYAPGTTPVEMRNVALQNGAAVIKHLPLINGIVLTLPAQASDKAREAILAHAPVISLEDDAIVTALAPPPGKGKPDKSGAAFAAEPTGGPAPLAVQFTDKSKGEMVSWEWSFGDGGISDAQHPQHTYTLPGAYTVSLTVTDSKGNVSTETKENYITATEPPPPQVLPWGVNRIDADIAWSAVTGVGIKVAVIDTGIDSSHPDLDDNYAGGVNIINTRKSPKDDNGHGTHCAGIIAAENNDFGVVGVAPGASLYAVKVLDRRGSGWTSDVIAGLQWCVANNMDVASMSLGSSSGHPDLKTAVEVASASVVLVAAAGNSGGAVIYPAAYADVIAVSATDSDDNLAYFSNFGEQIDLAAPGVHILSTYKGGEYKELNGTSMACPHVSGTVALMKANEVWSYDRLWNTADDIGLTSNQQGNGLVDAEEAATGVQTNP